MCSYLKNIDMIINTAPNLVINKTLITFINKDAYVLDVASYPHGIDKFALDQKSIKNNIYLGKFDFLSGTLFLKKIFYIEFTDIFLMKLYKFFHNRVCLKNGFLLNLFFCFSFILNYGKLSFIHKIIIPLYIFIKKFVKKKLTFSYIKSI